MKKLLVAALVGLNIITSTMGISAMGTQKVNEVSNIKHVAYAPNKEKTKITEYKDGSASVVNNLTKTYCFYPASLGDWFYEFNTKEELDNAIDTYFEISSQVKDMGNIKVTNKYTQKDGDKIIELSDDSYILYNKKENKYIFQPVCMGDWDLRLNNKQELKDVVTTYIEIKNNN